MSYKYGDNVEVYVKYIGRGESGYWTPAMFEAEASGVHRCVKPDGKAICVGIGYIRVVQGQVRAPLSEAKRSAGIPR